LDVRKIHQIHDALFGKFAEGLAGISLAARS
jgi:hypothetical protein